MHTYLCRQPQQAHPTRIQASNHFEARRKYREYLCVPRLAPGTQVELQRTPTDNEELARKLVRMALGDFYHETTLRKIAQMPVAEPYQAALTRCIEGNPLSTDHWELQRLACDIATS